MYNKINETWSIYGNDYLISFELSYKSIWIECKAMYNV